MSCCNASIELPIYYTGSTWPGATDVSLYETESGDAIAENLSLVVAKFKDSDGIVALTRSSAVSGEITITDANAWIFDLETKTPLGIDSGFYTIELTLTDATGYVRIIEQLSQRVI